MRLLYAVIFVALLGFVPNAQAQFYAGTGFTGPVAGFVQVVDANGNVFIQPVPFGYTTGYFGPGFVFHNHVGFVHRAFVVVGFNRFGRPIIRRRF